MTTRRLAVTVLIAVVTLTVAVASLIPIPSAACDGVYRIAWGLYDCEFNSEAGADFYCHEKIGGLREYLLLRDLTVAECRAREDLYYVPLIYRLGLVPLDQLWRDRRSRRLT